jgi:hypothetical protein
MLYILFNAYTFLYKKVERTLPYKLRGIYMADLQCKNTGERKEKKEEKKI